jgi:hypothetical protein
MLTMHNPTLYTTLVFIDLSVEDAQSLMSGVVPGRRSDSSGLQTEWS